MVTEQRIIKKRAPVRGASFLLIPIIAFILLWPAPSSVYGANVKYIILMIADGWGAKHIEATNDYTGSPPLYQTDTTNWASYFMSTYPDTGDYQPYSAWVTFNYMLTNPVTDSAAAATALYSDGAEYPLFGGKTENGRISVTPVPSAYFTIGEEAKAMNMAVGAITTVPASHATPGAWIAHNDSRANAYAIADEGLFGDPETTKNDCILQGNPPCDPALYSGHYGQTLPTVDVLIGDGSLGYINDPIRSEIPMPTYGYEFVDCQSGSIPDCGDALDTASGTPGETGVTKMAGLFDRSYRLANNSGADPKKPTLLDSTRAALTVLDRDTDGFILMIEGGAVDWASHANLMDEMVGEMIDFNDAVQEVIHWVENTVGTYWENNSNGSNWNNTLVIVTGDHETGFLTAKPNVFPNQALGEVSTTTLTKEKTYSGTLRASWEDNNPANNAIDSGETVHWTWNTGGHSNSLIPLYTRGEGSELFGGCIVDIDPVRRDYIDNTDVARVMFSAISGITQTGSLSIDPGQTLYGGSIDVTSIVNATNAANLNYTVTEGSGCPAQTNDPIITTLDTWKYNGDNLGDIGTTWKNTIYDDSGWTEKSGIFGYGDGYIYTPVGVPGSQWSMYFRKSFTICDASAVTSMDFNAAYDDGMAVYINGTRVITAGVPSTPDPPLWNGGATGHESNDGSSILYETFILDGHISSLVSGTNVIAVGIYNAGSTSSDLVFDGKLVIDHDATVTPLFSGNHSQAQSVNTSGWTEGEKKLEVTGEDGLCTTAITSGIDTFTWSLTSCDVTSSPTVNVDSVTSSSATISWTTVPNAISYKVYRDAQDLGTQTSPLTDTGRSANTSYNYSVVGVGSSPPACEGPEGNASALTLPDPVGDPTYSNVGETSLRVNWTAPASGADSYDVYRVGTGFLANTASLFYDDSGLTPDNQYQYYVIAKNASGDAAASGTTMSPYTLAVTPSQPTVNNATETTLDVTIGTDTNPVTVNYAIRINGGVFTNQNVQVNGSIGAAEVWQTKAAWATVTVTGLDFSTSYSFDVKARNSTPVETGFGPVGQGTTLACTDNDPSTITIPAAQTVYGDPYDVSGAFNTTGDVGSFEYKVTTGGGIGTCDIDHTGTYIDAEQFTAIVNQGAGGTSLSEVTQGGELNGSTSLRTGGGSGGNCDSIGSREGREYTVNFSQTGTYNVWMRGYATNGSDNSLFVGFDGACIVGITEPSSMFNQWGWTQNMQNSSGPGGTNPPAAQFTVNTSGLHTINIWVRENAHEIDGIYIDRVDVSNTPSDVSHGIEITPKDGCSTEVICTDWTSNNMIPASSTVCDPYVETTDNYNLYVRGTDPDCSDPVISNPVSQAFTWNLAYVNPDTTITNPAGGTLSGGPMSILTRR